jgi:hypothetical protein
MYNAASLLVQNTLLPVLWATAGDGLVTVPKPLRIWEEGASAEIYA